MVPWSLANHNSAALASQSKFNAKALQSSTSKHEPKTELIKTALRRFTLVSRWGHSMPTTPPPCYSADQIIRSVTSLLRSDLLGSCTVPLAPSRVLSECRVLLFLWSYLSPCYLSIYLSITKWKLNCPSQWFLNNWSLPGHHV